MRRPPRAVALLGAVAATAAALAGCGLGAGQAPSGVRLTVTNDFGRRAVTRIQGPQVRGEDTVMRLLQRNAKVTTRYGGGFVQSIDDLAGGRARGGRVDWFYYVNGVEAGKGAASTKVRAGDRIWWDRRQWTAAQAVPAVVGSFPEPFIHGVGGKRLPVRVECADPQSAPCAAVRKQLTDRGVVAGKGGLSASRSVETIRVVVGRWSAIAEDAAARLLARGPATSGVFARPVAGGRGLQVLDGDGRVVRTAGPGSGLVAALRVEGEQPVWTVTGTDDAGVAEAARAFDEGPLQDKYALAIVQGRGVALPVEPPA